MALGRCVGTVGGVFAILAVLKAVYVAIGRGRKVGTLESPKRRAAERGIDQHANFAHHEFADCKPVLALTLGELAELDHLLEPFRVPADTAGAAEDFLLADLQRGNLRLDLLIG